MRFRCLNTSPNHVNVFSLQMLDDLFIRDIKYVIYAKMIVQYLRFRCLNTSLNHDNLFSLQMLDVIFIRDDNRV